MNITCNFASKVDYYSMGVTTNCEMKTLNEIQCDTPLGFKPNSTTPLALFFNDILVQTDFVYTFVSVDYLRPRVTSSPSPAVKGLNYEEYKKNTIFKSMSMMFSNIIEKVKTNFY